LLDRLLIIIDLVSTSERLRELEFHCRCPLLLLSCLWCSVRARGPGNSNVRVSKQLVLGVCALFFHRSCLLAREAPLGSCVHYHHYSCISRRCCSCVVWLCTGRSRAGCCAMVGSFRDCIYWRVGCGHSQARQGARCRGQQGRSDGRGGSLGACMALWLWLFECCLCAWSWGHQVGRQAAWASSMPRGEGLYNYLQASQFRIRHSSLLNVQRFCFVRRSSPSSCSCSYPLASFFPLVPVALPLLFL
jgi:hypothetical protein